jgi:NitT/TauT family transport system permease protein
MSNVFIEAGSAGDAGIKGTALTDTGGRSQVRKYADFFPLTILKKFILVVLLITAWEIGPRLGWVDKTFLPSLSTILEEFGSMIKSGSLFRHLSVSLTRSVLGYSIAVLVGIPLGLIIGWYRTMADLLTLPVETFRNTSTLAMLPVFMLFLGIGEASKITIVAFGCLWATLLNTISGIKNVDPMLIKLARSMGLSSAGMFRKIILPSSIPSIFTGLRLSASTSVLIIISAEMVGAKSGIGFLITNSQFNFQIPRMYVGILTTTILGSSVNYLLMSLERRFTSWKPGISNA